MKLLILLALLAVGLRAQTATSYPANLLYTQWMTGTVQVPTSATSVTAFDSTLDRITLVNITGTVTCTVTDAAAANTLYVITFTGQANLDVDKGGQLATGGIKWSCNASGVTGFMRGKYVNH